MCPHAGLPARHLARGKTEILDLNDLAHGCGVMTFGQIDVIGAYGLRSSMSGKDNCDDNASVETFSKSLKAGLILLQAEAANFQYVNGSTAPVVAIHIWEDSDRSLSKSR